MEFLKNQTLQGFPDIFEIAQKSRSGEETFDNPGFTPDELPDMIELIREREENENRAIEARLRY